MASTDDHTRGRSGRLQAGLDRAQARLEGLAARRASVAGAVVAGQRDRRAGGAVLAGALAYRLFGALLPLALLLAVGLEVLAATDADAPSALGRELGLGDVALDSVADSARLNDANRWTVGLFAVGALLAACYLAAKAVRTVHALAWGLPIVRWRNGLWAALALLGTALVVALTFAAASRARESLGPSGTALTIVAVPAALCVFWLGVSRALPHPDVPWRALIPGAALMALGLQVLHLATVFVVVARVERASATYGYLGGAFAVLAWLYLVSRLIVGSAILNAAAWERRAAEESGAPAT